MGECAQDSILYFILNVFLFYTSHYLYYVWDLSSLHMGLISGHGMSGGEIHEENADGPCPSTTH